jgi:hypothetical protein
VNTVQDGIAVLCKTSSTGWDSCTYVRQGVQHGSAVPVYRSTRVQAGMANICDYDYKMRRLQLCIRQGVQGGTAVPVQEEIQYGKLYVRKGLQDGMAELVSGLHDMSAVPV